MSNKSVSDSSRDVQRALQERRAKREENYERRSNKSDALRKMGDKLFKEGNHTEALKSYKQALQYAVASKGVIYSSMVASYLELSLFEDAEEVATSALRYNPPDIWTRYRRALARRNLGKLKGAELDLAAILNMNEDHPGTEAEWEEVIDLCKDPTKIKDVSMRTKDLEAPDIYGREGYESDIESDSSDCHHSGNTTPCRFYNRDGCSKGEYCRFSHAPDEKSVRDDLGRNVCLHFILDTCKFGDKCGYCHTTEHLSEGWWQNWEENQDILDFLAWARHRKWPITRTAVHRAAWGETTRIVNVSDDESEEESGSGANGFILVLVLDDSISNLFTSVHHHLVSALQEKIRVVFVDKIPAAQGLIGLPNLAGVVVGDSAIIRKATTVLPKLVDYVNAGGKVVIGGCFSSFVRKDEMDMMFRRFGLTWEMGAYHRTTFIPNPSNAVVRANPSLDDKCSMKAVHLTSISAPDALYMPTNKSYIESHVFDPVAIADLNEAPIAGTRVGRGYLGYIGDVNGETGSTKAVLAMLGLLDATNDSHAPPPRPASTPSTPPTATNPCLKRKSSPFVIVLSFDRKNTIQTSYDAVLSSLQAKVEVLNGLSNDRVLDLLPSSGLVGLLITSPDIMSRKNSELLSAIIKWTKAGGRVVFAGFFVADVAFNQVPPFFKKWGFEWTADAYLSAEYVPNHKHILIKANPTLPKSHDVKALVVGGIKPEFAVYVAGKGELRYRKLSQVTESPVIYAPVGSGHLGFLGEVYWDAKSASIISAMLGLS